MVSPYLMLTGLARVSGVTGSLLLNLEAPFTMLIAVWSSASTWAAGWRWPSP